MFLKLRQVVPLTYKLPVHLEVISRISKTNILITSATQLAWNKDCGKQDLEQSEGKAYHTVQELHNCGTSDDRKQKDVSNSYLPCYATTAAKLRRSSVLVAVLRGHPTSCVSTPRAQTASLEAINLSLRRDKTGSDVIRYNGK